MRDQVDAIADALNPILGLLWLLAFLVLNFGLLILAWRHRNEIAGIVFALLYVAEQIHLKPENPFLRE